MMTLLLEIRTRLLTFSSKMYEKLQISEELGGMVFNFRPKFKDFMSQAHQHPELELNFVTSGEAVYYFSDVKYTMRPGSMVWILPNQNHRLSQWSDDFSMDIVAFTPNSLLSIDINSPEYEALIQNPSDKGVYCRVINHSVSQTISQIFKSLYTGNLHNDGVENQAPVYARKVFGRSENEIYKHTKPRVLNAGLAFLLTYCWDAFQSHGSDSDSKRIHAAVCKSIQFIQDNEACSHTVSSLAKACGLSESRFSRVFKENIGMSVPAYKNRVKLDHFLKLWQSNDMTLTEACYAANFGSYAQFHKVFKEQFKVSPKEYCYPSESTADTNE